MHILLVGVGYRGYTPLYARALIAMGHTVTTYVGLRQYDFATRVRRVATVRLPNALGANRDYLWSEQSRFHAWLRRNQPTVDLALFANSDRLANDDILEDLARRGIKSGVWLLDEVGTLATSDLDLRSFMYHASFSHSQQPLLEEGLGLPVPYVPQGFAPIEFEPSRAPWRSALVLGAAYPSRRAGAQALADAGCPVDVVGRTWKRHLQNSALIRIHADVPLGEAVARSSNARICVNGHRDLSAGVSPRVFEIAGAGGVIVDDNPQSSEFYDPGVEMLTWSTAEDIAQHIARLRADPAAARSLGQRAQNRTLAEHTIDKRFTQLLREWGFPADRR